MNGEWDYTFNVSLEFALIVVFLLVAQGVAIAVLWFRSRKTINRHLQTIDIKETEIKRLKAAKDLG